MFSVLIILGAACNGGDGEEGGISLPAGSERPPGQWPQGDFPLQIKFSDSFSQNERDALGSMAQEWEDLISGELNFFDFDSSSPTTNKNFSNTDSYRDSELGIYAGHVWPSQFGTSTLAVTQSFGFYAQDSGGIFVQMVHADIIFNYQDFNFSLTPFGFEFDLESVALHELGHFIGMKHDDTFQSSVMIPRISSGVIKRNPTSRDEEVLRSNYRIGPLVDNLEAEVSALKAGADIDSESSRSDLSDKLGEEVKIIIELKSDGTCNHYENDVLVHSHKEDISKFKSKKLN